MFTNGEKAVTGSRYFYKIVLKQERKIPENIHNCNSDGFFFIPRAKEFFELEFQGMGYMHSEGIEGVGSEKETRV